MLLKLCMCKHGLLDNTLACHKIMGIFHIHTSSQTSLMYFKSSGPMTYVEFNLIGVISA